MASTYLNARPEVRAGEALTLPARFYNDPELFKRELLAIHYDMWLYAGRAEQLPAPGPFFVVRFAGASVIVLRDERGAIAAFHNTCRHRGTLLCKADQGQLPGRIQCSYHAWTYGLDGQLLNAPLMEKVVGFREEEHPLGRVATVEWDGHVFINLSERPIPFAGAPRGPRPQVRALGDGGAAPRRAQGLPPEGQLEAGHPELLRVHPLSDRPPAVQQAVALHERRQRAAPAHLPGRAHGPAGGIKTLSWTARAPARTCRPLRRGPEAGLLLRAAARTCS